jgi:hypothetical protein
MAFFFFGRKVNAFQPPASLKGYRVKSSERRRGWQEVYSPAAEAKGFLGTGQVHERAVVFLD